MVRAIRKFSINDDMMKRVLTVAILSQNAPGVFVVLLGESPETAIPISAIARWNTK